MHEGAARIDLALLHNHVYNKEGAIVTTCITGFDLHDIARTTQTFGVGYYVVNELPSQQAFASRILQFWRNPSGKMYNATRAEAISSLQLKETLGDVIDDIRQETGEKPYIVATSAKSGSLPYATLKTKIQEDPHPLLLLFGTGWGLSQETLAQADGILEPLEGPTDYNHLSVRSAVAIVLDRLLGNRKGETEHVNVN